MTASPISKFPCVFNFSKSCNSATLNTRFVNSYSADLQQYIHTITATYNIASIPDQYRQYIYGIVSIWPSPSIKHNKFSYLIGRRRAIMSTRDLPAGIQGLYYLLCLLITNQLAINIKNADTCLTLIWQLLVCLDTILQVTQSHLSAWFSDTTVRKTGFNIYNGDAPNGGCHESNTR